MARYQVEIDRSLCTGYGVCELDAPGSFELDGDGIAVASAATDSAAVLEAARGGPRLPDGGDQGHRPRARPRGRLTS